MMQCAACRRVLNIGFDDTVRRAYVDPPDKPAYFNGHPAIILSVVLQQGVNGVDFGDKLTRKLDEIMSGDATDARHAIASPPAEAISATTASSSSAARSQATTAAPASASARAYARPMPCVAPVTMTTCSVKRHPTG